jgi:hypothetical protein
MELEYKQVVDCSPKEQQANFDTKFEFDECCICLDYLDKNLFTLTCCNNTIHNYCMVNWLEPSKSDTCFLCKQKIPNLNSLLDNKHKLKPRDIIIINNIINPYYQNLENITIIQIPNSNTNSNINNRNINEYSGKDLLLIFAKCFFIIFSLSVLSFIISKLVN